MRCALCKKNMDKTALQGHIKEHITKSFQKETEAFHETQSAVALYKKLFKDEP